MLMYMYILYKIEHTHSYNDNAQSAVYRNLFPAKYYSHDLMSSHRISSHHPKPTSAHHLLLSHLISPISSYHACRLISSHLIAFIISYHILCMSYSSCHLSPSPPTSSHLISYYFISSYLNSFHLISFHHHQQHHHHDHLNSLHVIPFYLISSHHLFSHLRS